LDWQVIQDELGTQLNSDGNAFRGFQFTLPAKQMRSRGKVLFAENF